MADKKIEYEISAKLDNIDKQFNALNKLAQDSARKIDSYFAHLGTSLKASLAGLASGLSVGAFAALIKNAVDAQDNLGDLSKKTSITVEDLAGLSLVARKSGSDLNDMAAAITKLSVNMGKEPEKYRAIGISAKEPIEAFKQLADVFVRIKDPQERAAFAAEALGKSWSGAAPALAEGGKSIGEMVEKGKQLSGVTAESAAKADELNDKLEELKSAASGAGVQFANIFVPSLTETAKAMEELASKGNPALALLRGFAGLGKLPFDLALGDVDMSLGGQIKDLETQLQDLQSKREAYNPFVLWGDSLQEIDQKILVTKNQLEALKKFGDQISKKPEQPKQNYELTGPPAGLRNFINPPTKPPAPKAPKADDPIGGLIDKLDKQNLDNYLKALESFQQMQRDLAAEAGDLTVAEKKFYDLINSPEWLTMDEPWKKLVTQQFEAANAAQHAAAYQEKLNALIADTPTAKAEKLRKEMELLQNALNNGDIGQQQYNEAVSLKLDATNEKIKEQKSLAEELGMTFSSAFEDAIVKGEEFSDVLEGLAQDILRVMVRKNVTEPLTNAIGSVNWGSLFANAKGGVYKSPSLSSYSSGVYDSPKLFAFASGAGVFAEAGPEAIMPLARDSQGRLGVRSQGDGGSNVAISITVNEATGSSQSSSSGDKAAAWKQMASRVRQVVVDEMVNQKRAGGVLYGA